jgi:DNA-directed RNA polymerase subunit L
VVLETYAKRVERKSNHDVLEIVGEERSLMNLIRKRRWKMVGHTLRHPEELHSTILEVTIEGK